MPAIRVAIRRSCERPAPQRQQIPTTPQISINRAPRALRHCGTLWKNQKLRFEVLELGSKLICRRKVGLRKRARQKVPRRGDRIGRRQVRLGPDDDFRKILSLGAQQKKCIERTDKSQTTEWKSHPGSLPQRRAEPV